MSANLQFLTRPACHLCWEVAPVVQSVARWSMTRLQIVDIDEDAQLAVDFGLRIPLVRWDTGQVVAEGQIDRAMLLRRVLAGRLRRSLRDGAGTTKR